MTSTPLPIENQPSNFDQHDAFPQKPSAERPQGLDRVFLGELEVSRDRISGPYGSLPTEGSTVFVTNMSRVERAIPTWAIIVAIAGFFVLTIFSLLFLLVKEDRVVGGYEVRISNPTGTLTSFVPVDARSAAWIWQDLQGRAAAARELIASVTSTIR
ncbi:hypothetical protein [Pseudoclavibacter sp. VKM Ac-2867]|uniref:hypothetical protein n=1 Tax=Pseudoclavibacter sp. VKM Ac-2867 TaxID=2783829 RepID=UPI00188D7950|nr:hypothetical protein [Pseudoclavibacter sp. VKM Ac-2867]MBF4458118.1 hypothetical protein [Pseudoclavibacter sp. VKM Ac-2867]